jgi:acyl dehydratase
MPTQIDTSVRFAGLLRLGDVITRRGKVVAKRAGEEPGAPHPVELELWAENAKGDTVITGHATAALLSRA